MLERSFVHMIGGDTEFVSAPVSYPRARPVSGGDRARSGGDRPRRKSMNAPTC